MEKYKAACTHKQETATELEKVSDTAGPELLQRWTAAAEDAMERRDEDPSAMDIYDVTERDS